VTGVQTCALPISLNFNIPQGTNYQLRCGTTTPNLYRNNTGTTFPYTVPGVVSITGTNASDVNYYYYYYNWVISYDGGCVSSRTPVTATINTIPTDVTVTGGGTQCGGNATLTATGGTGGTIYWQNTTNNGTSTATASSSQTVSTSGTYYFRALAGTSCWGNQGSASVTINPVPTAVTGSGGGTQCGGSMTLKETGGTGGLFTGREQHQVEQVQQQQAHHNQFQQVAHIITDRDLQQVAGGLKVRQQLQSTHYLEMLQFPVVAFNVVVQEH
jgi:hypothetical protein